MYQRGRTVRSGPLAVKFMFNERRHTYRCAVVVSKKVHKSAVARNRIRRRIYEIVRQDEGNIKASYDIVITVFSSEVADIPPNQLQNMLLSLFKQADMLS